MITLRCLLRDEFYDSVIDLKKGKVDSGDAILPEEKVGDVFVREEAKLHQGGAQATFGFFLDLICLVQLLWGNDLLFDEKVTQPLRHTSISYPRGETMANDCTGIRRELLP